MLIETPSAKKVYHVLWSLYDYSCLMLINFCLHWILQNQIKDERLNIYIKISINSFIGLPTPPQPCQDKIPNCSVYGQATCSNPDYRSWASENCMKYCGMCSGGSGIVHLQFNLLMIFVADLKDDTHCNEVWFYATWSTYLNVYVWAFWKKLTSSFPE